MLATGLEAALDGRPTPAGGGAPKKSKPINESCGLAGFETDGAAVCMDLLDGMSVVFRRGGGSKSPKRSTLDCCCGGACTGGGRPVLGAAAACFCDALLSILAFSCTTLSGTSSSSPSVEGSGMGPSITHRFDSYFVRIKFSILASDGTCPGCSFASQYLFALALPHFRTLCSCSSVQASRSTDLTREMCVPIPRWMPEHLMHTNTPRFQLAHRGCLFRLQSAHTLFPSSLTRALSVWAFCAARSLPAAGRFRFIVPDGVAGLGCVRGQESCQRVGRRIYLHRVECNCSKAAAIIEISRLVDISYTINAVNWHLGSPSNLMSAPSKTPTIQRQ